MRLGGLVSSDRVVVCDSSCLIHLRKGKVTVATMELPYRFVIPYPIREDELLSFTDREKRRLESKGLETYDLPGDQTEEAFVLKSQHPGLSAYDCFAFVAAKHHEGSILLTGDGSLRHIAEKNQMEVHGVLWITDELEAAGVCDGVSLIKALEAWKNDETVFLPKDEIEQRLRHFRSKHH